jgi:predicted phosphoribosyltransferase
MLERIALSDEQIDEGIARTRSKVDRRIDTLREGRNPLDLKERSLILVDDGSAMMR